MISRVILIPTFAIFALSGCGQKGASTGTEAPAPNAASSASAKETSAIRTVEISANDQMKFNVTSIEAKPGEELRVILTNVGTMPKEAMGHNWVLLKANTNPISFAAASAGARETDYIAPTQKDQILAATPLLGPKQKAEVVFKAPDQPGQYPYVCTFPGHAALMKGTLTVR